MTESEKKQPVSVLVFETVANEKKTNRQVFAPARLAPLLGNLSHAVPQYPTNQHWRWTNVLACVLLLTSGERWVQCLRMRSNSSATGITTVARCELWDVNAAEWYKFDLSNKVLKAFQAMIFFPFSTYCLSIIANTNIMKSLTYNTNSMCMLYSLLNSII